MVFYTSKTNQKDLEFLDLNDKPKYDFLIKDFSKILRKM